MDDYLIQSSDNAKDNLLKIVLCLTDKMVISNRWYFINRFANGSLVNDNISDIWYWQYGIANTVFEYRKSAIEGIKMKVLRCLIVWYKICICVIDIKLIFKKNYVAIIVNNFGPIKIFCIGDIAG